MENSPRNIRRGYTDIFYSVERRRRRYYARMPEARDDKRTDEKEPHLFSQHRPFVILHRLHTDALCLLVHTSRDKTDLRCLRVKAFDAGCATYETTKFSIAEGPREALVSRNPATTKHLT